MPSDRSSSTGRPWSRRRPAHGRGAPGLADGTPGPSGEPGEPGPTGVARHRLNGHAPAGAASATAPSGLSEPDAVASGGPTGSTGDAAAAPDATASPDGAAGVAGPPTTGRRGRRAAEAAGRRKAPWWELPLLVVVAVVVAILVKTFLIQPFYIPSASMERTLHGCPGCSGDRVIVEKPVYTVFRDPHPGDIVVFRAPPGWDDEVTTTAPGGNPIVQGVRWFGQLVGVVPPDEEDLIKRVIAVGGQTVKCCDAAGNVQISDNGPSGTFRSLADSSYVYEEPGMAAFGQLPFGPVTVPKGRLWVMGDHRNDSKDSRYHCGGTPTATTAVCADGGAATATSATVPISDVIGKAVVIAWPPSRWTTLGTPPTFATVPLPSAAGDAVASAGLGGALAVAPVGVGLLTAAGVGAGRRRGRRARHRRPAGRGRRSA